MSARWLGALACLAAFAASAQPFPAKPIRWVTQFVAGSSGDIALRIVAPPMSRSLGQPVVIDNRAGAGGVLAAEQVMRAPPDGYTILAVSNAVYVTRRFLVREMSFDALKDFAAVTQYLDSYFVWVAAPSFPAGSLREALDLAKKSPGKMNFATSGIGTEGHLTGEQVMELTGVKLLHVPYKAAAQALVDTVTGQVQTALSTYSGALPHVSAGKLRILAVVRDARSARLPDVPTVAEAVPGFEAPSSGVGIFAPAGTPSAILNRIQSEIARASKDPEAQQKLRDGAYEVLASTPEEFTARMKREIALTARLVKSAGIKPE
jgi:tripartite-type tricarboxylate transporter receptor subunit TctC